LVIVIHVSLSYSIDAQCNLGHGLKDTPAHDTPLSLFPPDRLRLIDAHDDDHERYRDDEEAASLLRIILFSHE